MSEDIPPHSGEPPRQPESFEEILIGISENLEKSSTDDEMVGGDISEHFDPPLGSPARADRRDFSRPEMEELEAAQDLVMTWAYVLQQVGATSAKLCEGVVVKSGTLRKMVGISQILAAFEDGDHRHGVRVFLRAVPGWEFGPGPAPTASVVDQDGNYVEVKRELLEADAVSNGRTIVCFHGEYVQEHTWQPTDRVLCCVGYPDEGVVRAFLAGGMVSQTGPVDRVAPEIVSSRRSGEIDPKKEDHPVRQDTRYTEHPRWRTKMLGAIERLAHTVVPDIDRIQDVVRSLEANDRDEDDLHSRILNITARLLEVSDELVRVEGLRDAEDVSAGEANPRMCLTRCLTEIERAVGLDEALLEPIHGEKSSAFDDMRRLSQNMARGRFEHAMTLMDNLVAGLREEISWHSGYASKEAMMLLVAAEQALVLRECLAHYNAEDPRLDVEIRSKTAARAFREAGLKPLLSVAAAMGRSEMMDISGIGDVTMKRVLAEVEATGAPSVLQTSFEADSYGIDERIRAGIANGALGLDGKLGPKLRPDAALAATAVLRKSAYGTGGLRATMIDELARDRLHDLLSSIEDWRRSESSRVRSPEYLSKFARNQRKAF